MVDAETGKYTLPYEPNERTGARGSEHPEIDPGGISIKPADEANVTVCLQCHAAGNGNRAGMEVIAPLSLRNIVHPAYIDSRYFKLYCGGSCFTCHYVNGEGGWELLTEKVEVNEKGANPVNCLSDHLLRPR